MTVHRLPAPSHLAAALRSLSDRRLAERADHERALHADLVDLARRQDAIEDRLQELAEPPWGQP